MTGYAYNLAKELYDDGELEEIIQFCMENGVVYSEDDLFLCAYPTSSGHITRNPEINLDIADTWYVYIATGNIKRVFEIAKPLKYVSFERFDKTLRLIEFKKVRRILLWADKTARDGD